MPSQKSDPDRREGSIKESPLIQGKKKRYKISSRSYFALEKNTVCETDSTNTTSIHAHYCSKPGGSKFEMTGQGDSQKSPPRIVHHSAFDSENIGKSTWETRDVKQTENLLKGKPKARHTTHQLEIGSLQKDLEYELNKNEKSRNKSKSMCYDKPIFESVGRKSEPRQI